MKFDGKRLKERRELYGLSLDKLADIVGSTKSYLWELETKNKSEPSGQKVLMMSKALGVSMEHFYGEDDTLEPIKKAIILLSSGCIHEIGVNTYMKISDLLYPKQENSK